MTTSISRVPRRMPGWAKVLTAVVVVIAVLFAGLRLAVLPGLRDIFGTETTDRSGPALLKSIQDMSRYDAASGNFQVVVDLEKDAKYLPDAIRGTRTLYVGAGTVEGYVDLGKLGKQDVTVNADRTSASIKLPHATLGKLPWTRTTPTRSPSNGVCSTASGTYSPTTPTVNRPCRSSRRSTSARRRRPAA